MAQRRIGWMMLALLLPCAGALAAEQQNVASPIAIDRDKPIEIAADSLEVLQTKHIAIFTGNVIAVQGVNKMRADQMTVYYRQGKQGSKPAAPAAAAAAAPAPAAGDAMSGNNIYRIESEGSVVLTNPTEVANGDLAVYDVDADTFDLFGNVVLTRDKNVLKGTKLHYNLANGRSVLTAGVEKTPAGVAVGGGRVHGLFVPAQKSDAGSNNAGAEKNTTGTTVQPTGNATAK